MGTLHRLLMAQSRKAPAPQDYIQFEDEEVAFVCAFLFGDRTGLTYERAAEVTPEEFEGAFAGSGITTFRELRRFTSLQELPAYSFDCCDLLEAVELPEGMEFIAEGAFAACAALTDVKLPSTLLAIGESAFQDCCSLDMIKLPEGLQLIFDDAFSGCTSLGQGTPLTLPESLEEMGPRTFCGCVSLQQVVLPQHLTHIQTGAFCGCDLRFLDIPAAVANLETECFADNPNLAYVQFQQPSQLQRIWSQAFVRSMLVKGAYIHIPWAPGSVVQPTEIGVEVFTEEYAPEATTPVIYFGKGESRAEDLALINDFRCYSYWDHYLGQIQPWYDHEHPTL